MAFITAGGIHKKSQVPFNTSGDFSYRVIERDTPTSELMVTHGGFDNSDINKDVNAMFPIDRLRELVREGFIGSLAEETYTFRCTVCGWEVTVDTPELPEDFVCEVCGVGPDMFELVED